jgi:hypothetical protein
MFSFKFELRVGKKTMFRSSNKISKTCIWRVTDIVTLNYTGTDKQVFLK